MGRYFSSIFLIEAVVIDADLLGTSGVSDDAKNGQRLIICRDWEKYFDFFNPESLEKLFTVPGKNREEWSSKRNVPEFLLQLNERLKKAFPLMDEMEKSQYRPNPIEIRNLSERFYELNETNSQKAKTEVDEFFDEFYARTKKDGKPPKENLKKDPEFKRVFDVEKFFSDHESLFRTDGDFPIRDKPLSSKLEGIFFDTIKRDRKLKSLERLIRSRKIPEENVFFVEIPIPELLRKYADVKEPSPRYELVFFERGEYVFRGVDNEIHA